MTKLRRKQFPFRFQLGANPIPICECPILFHSNASVFQHLRVYRRLKRIRTSVNRYKLAVYFTARQIVLGDVFHIQNAILRVGIKVFQLASAAILCQIGNIHLEYVRQPVSSRLRRKLFPIIIECCVFGFNFHVRIFLLV
ncbi:hypothetical protein D3C85_1036000 [compost metagenome]